MYEWRIESIFVAKRYRSFQWLCSRATCLFEALLPRWSARLVKIQFRGDIFPTIKFGIKLFCLHKSSLLPAA